MQEATEGGALTSKCAELVRRELKVVHLSRDQVALEEELRDVKSVIHILCNERDLNALVNWDNEFWIVLGGAVDLNPLGWVAELPLPLVAHNFHLYRNLLWLTGVNNAEHLGGCEEEANNRNERDHRPNHLKNEVAVRLGRKASIVWLTPILDDRPDNQPFHQYEDEGCHHKDEHVEVLDQETLLRHSRWREGSLTAAEHECHGEKGDQRCRFTHLKDCTPDP